VALPINVAKNVISGTLPSGEVWQVAYWTQLTSAPAFTDASTAAAAASSDFVAMMNAWKPLCGNTTAATAYDQYGFTGGSSASSHGHATISYTGSGTSFHPNQIAVVTTLRTAHAGRSGRGRMYWPATAAPVPLGQGFFQSSDINPLVDAIALHFTARNTGGNATSVVSQTLAQSFPITSVDADTVPDTQRRRANKLRSVRHSHSV